MQFSLVHDPKYYSASDQMKINQDESVFSGEERKLKQKITRKMISQNF
jgi:hypothetical protein